MTEPATHDLQEVENYIGLDNPNAATQTVMHVLAAIEYLVTYPTMGRIGRVPKTRELVVSGTPFIVVYQIRHQIIFILRVLHTARKWT